MNTVSIYHLHSNKGSVTNSHFAKTSSTTVESKRAFPILGFLVTCQDNAIGAKAESLPAPSQLAALLAPRAGGL